MLISTKGRYALRIMLDLAQQEPGAFIPLPAIAERQEASEKYLESIISTLAKAGLVEGQRGKGGGYRLARNPDNYSVGEILRLAEGIQPCAQLIQALIAVAAVFGHGGGGGCLLARDFAAQPVFQRGKGVGGLIAELLPALGYAVGNAIHVALGLVAHALLLAALTNQQHAKQRAAQYQQRAAEKEQSSRISVELFKHMLSPFSSAYSTGRYNGWTADCQ